MAPASGCGALLPTQSNQLGLLRQRPEEPTNICILCRFSLTPASGRP